MAKIFKKQIERSIPVFVIISLIMSSTAMGLFFNINFDIYKLIKTKSAVIDVPDALAVDMASTTVEVQNAPPVITIAPAEVPASTSTSPVNVGANLSIQVTATDGESNGYYLLICSSDSIIPDTSGGENHRCGATTFGSSTMAASGAQATTTFAVTDPGAEYDDWYAFVCDNHATQADCSVTGNQGAAPNSGDNSSPFYVNHAPSFSSVLTSSDNKNPGNSGDPFVVTASATDGDVMGGIDELAVYVCSTDSWTIGSGCAGTQLCYGTSTAPDVSCSFATSTPAADGSYPYYAFVRDWHNMAAIGNSKTSNYNVNNVAPVIGSVILHDSEDIIVNMKGMDEVAATTTSTSVSDNNGCLDVATGGYATSSIYWSSVANAQFCAANDNNCYQIGTADCVISAGSCTGNSDADLTYVCSTTIAYHAIPTDDATGSPYVTSNWLGSLTVTDDDGLNVTATSSVGVDLITLVALEVSEITIPYNSVKASQNTGAYNATTTIVNYGNSPLDSGVDVNDMDKDDMLGDLIEAENQQFSTSTFIYGSGSWSVEEASSTFQVDIVAAKPTSQANVSDQIYWGIGIPAGKPSGTYTGQNVFTAILDDDRW
ncbi:MAG: hypothetical protein US83_C0008G0002 [Candidatus Falkowbacteria bacterium GW2011_GWC2_38_22]|uniref:Uncharacterized protein n=1 Tax=Candidatus Falkowbacteria bacterium GW2011_GWE1_38_31 TaxID=1618638 RepID=A0A0G0JR53_9BACT|nr:MAG: hypothetical protein US73_C0006G0001 [Candidatus Falkowbacteria bacterium GW2011_GWF2_38_1205]KKQ61161.1 MAG: hypothetical protein US83_C0008G0002 [Candidatus Falkowbacteria bacterium GW2011_GWC2_38_22]KKQ63331.1 MAG: hypothetical protein US84_C0007G0073 [Candidatus Falkowbacteria bacterium GW2011_GWF1_38_22]KKQ65551.1 MAG: hypothetical protein US87_C0006G0001 [Candidatus Falkowbacteria bacterium GW2011_GWE2_38_254]KKQ70063.1 MAG: hypothetical protein US91_C0007G0073 [Candidatus Falkowb